MHVWFVEFRFHTGGWQPFDWFPRKRGAKEFIALHMDHHKHEANRYRIRKYTPTEN